MSENSDLPKPVRDDGVRTHTPKWRPGLEPIPMFEEADSVKLEVEILEENYRELLALIKANEWSMDEGLRTVFLAGLGFQIGQRHLDAITALADLADPGLTNRVDVMVNELASYHSMYSVLKFKAFKLYKLNQALEFNNSGLRAQEDMWQEWAARMRRDKEELQAEIVRLRSLLAEFKLDWDSAGGPPLPPGLAAAVAQPRPEQVATPSANTGAAGESDIWRKTSPPNPGFWARLRRFFGHAK